MKDGNNTQRLEDTPLDVSYSVIKVDAACYALYISYKTNGDVEALQWCSRKQNCQALTYELACKFSKIINASNLFNAGLLDLESYIGDALVQLRAYSIDSIKLVIEKMKAAANDIGAKLTQVKIFDGYSVDCSIITSLAGNNTYSYQIKISYSNPSGTFPLSTNGSTEYVHDDTFEFASYFTSMLCTTKYASLYSSKGIIEECYCGNILLTIDCKELVPALTYLNETAKFLGCKLSFIALPSSTCHEYPQINLCQYRVS